MEVKIDTKEKFTVVTPITLDVSANIAADLIYKCGEILDLPVKNLILNLEAVSQLDKKAIEGITNLQQRFYEQNASFVICCIGEALETILERYEVLDLWNTTPTESEAWDIVQMEEIERELLDSSDVEFPDED